MHLAKFLKRPGDASKFAEKVGVSIPTVYRWINGECMPGREMMLRISQASGGRVRPRDFYTDPVDRGHVGGEAVFFGDGRHAQRVSLARRPRHINKRAGL
jgi:DNA-binding transcriptional regulator YdaS (Cro superfamily)